LFCRSALHRPWCSATMSLSDAGLQHQRSGMRQVCDSWYLSSDECSSLNFWDCRWLLCGQLLHTGSLTADTIPVLTGGNRCSWPSRRRILQRFCSEIQALRIGVSRLLIFGAPEAQTTCGLFNIVYSDVGQLLTVRYSLGSAGWLAPAGCCLL
jgi:hypothetical protein